MRDGASLVTVDATSLAIFSVDGLTLGTVIYLSSNAVRYILTATDSPSGGAVAAAGYANLYWEPMPAGTGTVESVTGDGVDNSDPDNPVINLTNVIDSTMIQDDAIGASAIADNAVVRAAIADDAVGPNELDQTGAYDVLRINSGPGDATTPAFNCASPAKAGLYSHTSGGIVIVTNGINAMVFEANGSSYFGQGKVYFNSGLTQGISLVSSVLKLFSDANVQIGADGALADAATVGFLTVPTCPGVPSGVVTGLSSGKAAIVLGETGGTPKLYYSLGGGTWVAIGP